MSQELFQTKQAILQAILLGGFSAGVLDFTGACVSNAARGVTPLRVAQSVASGVLGAKAFQAPAQGGYRTAALGVALHFLIAFGAATVFCLACLKLRWLAEHPWQTGALYGVAVYWFMQLVVLPLSAIAFKRSFAWRIVLTGLIVHVLCVGWPIAWAAYWRLNSSR
ncbi:MAG TPA: hypothetical protein PLD20_04725 [Blastocatellia bacterium]|nr:hypothetical protein [Blastocatellia bacterium]HMX24567.1 hypothetical protein [Blastocatellia bacterium]HMZ17212.1 hypothetical protein [Blastocatellia bacterium]HNG29657.1 hypothetical protein [Blastocatellia bacterium]